MHLIATIVILAAYASITGALTIGAIWFSQRKRIGGFGESSSIGGVFVLTGFVIILIFSGVKSLEQNITQETQAQLLLTNQIEAVQQNKPIEGNMLIAKTTGKVSVTQTWIGVPIEKECLIATWVTPQNVIWGRQDGSCDLEASHANGELITLTLEDHATNQSKFNGWAILILFVAGAAGIELLLGMSVVDTSNLTDRTREYPSWWRNDETTQYWKKNSEAVKHGQPHDKNPRNMVNSIQYAYKIRDPLGLNWQKLIAGTIITLLFATVYHVAGTGVIGNLSVRWQHIATIIIGGVIGTLIAGSILTIIERKRQKISSWLRTYHQKISENSDTPWRNLIWLRHHFDDTISKQARTTIADGHLDRNVDFTFNTITTLDAQQTSTPNDLIASVEIMTEPNKTV